MLEETCLGSGVEMFEQCWSYCFLGLFFWINFLEGAEDARDKSVGFAIAVVSEIAVIVVLKGRSQV